MILLTKLRIVKHFLSYGILNSCSRLQQKLLGLENIELVGVRFVP